MSIHYCYYANLHFATQTVPLSYDITERRTAGVRTKWWSNCIPVVFAHFMVCTLNLRISTPVLASYSASSYGAWGDTQDDICVSVETRTAKTVLALSV